MKKPVDLRTANVADAGILKEASHLSPEIEVIVSQFDSPVGELIAAATDDGVCLLDFLDRKSLRSEFKDLGKRLKAKFIQGETKWHRQLKEELTEYFAGTRREFTIPLIFPGTPFQMKAWETLRKIPYGKTWSYREEAEKLGNPAAIRAVGTANGKNRIAILIPCHRVIGAGGHLVGYGGGLWRKEALLKLEGAI